MLVYINTDLKYTPNPTLKEKSDNDVLIQRKMAACCVGLWSIWVANGITWMQDILVGNEWMVIAPLVVTIASPWNSSTTSIHDKNPGGKGENNDENGENG
ncbi:MAG: hypothetical protein ACTSUE_17090, partial [Promethearchaeota archaeon]